MTTPVLSIVDITPAGDLVPFGSEFSITLPARDVDRSYYWTNLAPTTGERFFVMESLTTRGGSVRIKTIVNCRTGLMVRFMSEKSMQLLWEL